MGEKCLFLSLWTELCKCVRFWRHWGAFAGTDLEQQLKNRGIDTVVLTEKQQVPRLRSE
jgi:hypothetical protein